MPDVKKRVKRIFELMDHDEKLKTKPSSFILANGVEPHADSSFFYVTGFPYGLFEGSYFIGRRDGTTSLITTPLEEPIARAHAQKDLQIYVEGKSEGFDSRIKNIVGSGAVTIGVNSPELSFRAYLHLKSVLKNCEFEDVSDAFDSARLIKDSDEIANIQKACDIASKVHKKIPSMLRVGVTESTVAAGMAYEMQSLGGSGVSFDSIVGFGKNTALPHYSAGNAMLKKGQFVLCDYGTRYQRYCSDITRTLVFDRASAKHRRMYEVVRTALQMGTDLCTPEYTGSEVHNKVARYIDSTEFKGKFIHGTGHSLGLNVHDGIGLSSRNKKNLQPGMVVTVEPGIYLKSFGGVRIEDDVLITKGKARVLTSASREFIEV
ncbi:MAG: aminopeptidase P family protein [Nitrososphaerota archaeon]|nr:aminopeptidase P family protein [Nitrososphaerota archaeon]